LALEKKAILKAAMDVLADEGLEHLSMRRLAERLAVRAPSLYWHYSGKEELLADMAADLLGSVAVDVDPALPAMEIARRVVSDLRAMLLRNRNASHIVARQFYVHPQGLRLCELLIGSMVRDGFAPESAAQACFTLVSFVQGFVLDEQALARDATEVDIASVLKHLDLTIAETYPTATAALADRLEQSSDQRFAAGLDLLLSALEAPRASTPEIDRFIAAFRSVR
jgi:TetR/AcrR family transcriptional regulator, tetracycline repressor protein